MEYIVIILLILVAVYALWVLSDTKKVNTTEPKPGYLVYDLGSTQIGGSKYRLTAVPYYRCSERVVGIRVYLNKYSELHPELVWYVNYEQILPAWPDDTDYARAVKLAHNRYQVGKGKIK